MPATSEKGKGKCDPQGKHKKNPFGRRNSSKQPQPMLQTDGVIVIPDKSDSSDVILISTSPSSSESDLPTVSKVLKRCTPSPKLSDKIREARTIKGSRKTLGASISSSKLAESHRGTTKSTVESKPSNPIILDNRGTPQKRNSFILPLNTPTPPKKNPVLLANDRPKTPRKQQRRDRKMHDGDKPQHGLQGNSLTGRSDVHHVPVGNSIDMELQRTSGTASRLTTGGKSSHKVLNKTTIQQAKTAPQSRYRSDPMPRDGHRKSMPLPRNSALVSSGRAASHSHATSRKSEGGSRRSTDTARSVVGTSDKPTGNSLQAQSKSLNTSSITTSVSHSGLSSNLNLKSPEILPPHMAFPNSKFKYQMVDCGNFPRVKSQISPPRPSSHKLESPSISTASKGHFSPEHFTARSPPQHSSQKATSKGHLSPTQYKKSISPVAARPVGSPPSQKLSVSATSRDDPSPSLPKKHSSKTSPVAARTRSPSLTSQLLFSSKKKLGILSYSIPRKAPVSNSSPAQQRQPHFLSKSKSTSYPSRNSYSKLDVTGPGVAPRSSKHTHGSVSTKGDSCKRTAGGNSVIGGSSSESGLSQDQVEDLDEIGSIVSIVSSSDWSSVASDSETDRSLNSASFHPSSGRKKQTARKSTGGKLSKHGIRRKVVTKGFDLKLNKIKVSSGPHSSSSTIVNAVVSGMPQQVQTNSQASHLPPSLPGSGGHSQQPSNTTQSSLPPGLPLLQSRKRKLAKRLPSMLTVSSDSESKRTKFQPAGRTSKLTLSSVEPGTSAAQVVKKRRLSEPHPPSTSATANLSDCKSDSLAIRNPMFSDSHLVSTPSAASGSYKSDSIAAVTMTAQVDPEFPSSPVTTSGYESDSLAIKKPRLSQPDSHSRTSELYRSADLASKKTEFPESDLLVGSAGSDFESPIAVTVTNLDLSVSCEDSLEMESTCARTMVYRPHPIPLEPLNGCARTRPFPVPNHPVKQSSGVAPLLPTLDSGRAQHSPNPLEYSSGFQLHMDTESSDSEDIVQVPTKQRQSIPGSLAANQSSDGKPEGTDCTVESTAVGVSCDTDEMLSAKEKISVSVANETCSPEPDARDTDDPCATTQAGGAAEGEKDQKQRNVPPLQLLKEKDHHRSQKCVSKLSHTHSRRPLILSHPRISLINSCEQPSARSPKSTCSFDVSLDSSSDAEECDAGAVGTPRLLSPREEEYNQRLQDTILKLANGVELTETPPFGSRPTAEDDERNSPMIVSINRSQLQRQPSLPRSFYCTQPRGDVTRRAEVTQSEGFTIQRGGVLTHRLGTYVSKGVQAERGMIVDKEVLDSYLAVKLNEALYEMKEQLQVTERQVKSVIKEKERLERALREKVKLIRDLTTTGFKPIMVDQETGMEPVAVATASTQTSNRTPRRSIKQQKGVSVATQTEDSVSRPHLPTSSSRRKRLQRMYCLQHFHSQEIEEFLRRIPPPISPNTAQESAEPEPQDDKSPVQKKSVWLSALDTETSSRCIAIRPQVRLNRALSQLASREASQLASREASQHATREASHCEADVVERGGFSQGGLVPSLQVLCRKVLEKENGTDSNTYKSDHNGTEANVPATAVGSNLASDDHTGWTLLGCELQGLFKQLLHLFLVLKKLPVEHVLKGRASRIVDLLGHLLSHLPLPSRHDLTEAAQSIDDAQKYRTVGVSTWLFGFKLKELLRILECVRMDCSRLPAYFRAEVLQLKRTTSNTLNFAVSDLRHITVLHDASGCEVLSSVAPPPFHSDQLPIPPLPPMDNLLCDDLDDLDSSSSLSSLGSSESEEDEEEGEGEEPYTAARVVPVVKYNTHHGHGRRSSTPHGLKTKRSPVDAPPRVTHTHRTPPSTSALHVPSPATRTTPKQGQSTPASLSSTTPITSHSEDTCSKTKLALLEHLETQIHQVLGKLSSRSSTQLPNATNPLGAGAPPGARQQACPANMLRLNAHDILRATSKQSSKDLAMTLSPTSPVSGVVCTSRIPPKQFTHISNILGHSHPPFHSPANAMPNLSPPANPSPSLVGTSSVFPTATAPGPTTCTTYSAAPPHFQTNLLSPIDTRVIGSYGVQPLVLSHGSMGGSLPQLPISSPNSPVSHTPNPVPPIMMSLAAGYLAMCTNSSTSPANSTLPSQPKKTLPHSLLSCPPPTLFTSTKPLPICSIKSSSSAPLISGSVASGSVSSSGSGSESLFGSGSGASSISDSVASSGSGSVASSGSGSVSSSGSGSVTSLGSGSVISSGSGSVTSSGSGSVISSGSGSVTLSGSGSRSSSVALLPATDVSMVSQPSTSTFVPSITTTTNTTATNATTTAAPRSHEISLSTTSITTSIAGPCSITASKMVKPSIQPNPPTTKNQAGQVCHSSQAISTDRATQVNLKESRNQPPCLPVTSSSSVGPPLPTPRALTRSVALVHPVSLGNDVTTSLSHWGHHNQHVVPSPARAQARPSRPIVPISTAFPVPKVQVKTSEQGVVIKWTFSDENLHHQTSVTKYELYAHAISPSVAIPPVHQWGKVGVIKPLSLPMAVTLTNFSKGQIYLFSVRAFFPGGCSVYSEPRTISP